jgi:hypothetical protein
VRAAAHARDAAGEQRAVMACLMMIAHHDICCKLLHTAIHAIVVDSSCARSAALHAAKGGLGAMLWTCHRMSQEWTKIQVHNIHMTQLDSAT